MTDRPPPPPMMEPPEAATLPTWFWAIGALAVFGLFIGLMLLVPALYGVRQYVENAKVAEARTALGQLSAGIAQCAMSLAPDGQPRGLPESTRPVPAQLSSVRGTKYQSSPGEWREDAFACAGFSMTTPQYFSYRWQKLEPAHGVVSAFADLDGDGVPDHEFKQAVRCTEGVCSVEPLVEPDDARRD